MSADAEETSVARLKKSMDLAFSHFDDGTLPLERIITDKVCRKFLKLTRLYRLPMPNLKDGVKQATYYSRVKVRKLLETVLERYGLAVIFLYSQATNETQLRHLDIEFMLGHAEPWSRKAVQSQRLKDIVRYLSEQLLSSDSREGITDLQNTAPPPEPRESTPVENLTLRCEGNNSTPAEDEAGQSQQSSATVTESLPTTTTPFRKRAVLEMDAKSFADFLQHESGGGVLSIICEYGQHPAPPYIELQGRAQHRMTLTFELIPGLIQYMKHSGAEPRTDGTFALKDVRRQFSADPIS